MFGIPELHNFGNIQTKHTEIPNMATRGNIYFPKTLAWPRNVNKNILESVCADIKVTFVYIDLSANITNQ